MPLVDRALAPPSTIDIGLVLLQYIWLCVICASDAMPGKKPSRATETRATMSTTASRTRYSVAPCPRKYIPIAGGGARLLFLCALSQPSVVIIHALYNQWCSANLPFRYHLPLNCFSVFKAEIIHSEIAIWGTARAQAGGGVHEVGVVAGGVAS